MLERRWRANEVVRRLYLGVAGTATFSRTSFALCPSCWELKIAAIMLSRAPSGVSVLESPGLHPKRSSNLPNKSATPAAIFVSLRIVGGGEVRIPRTIS